MCHHMRLSMANSATPHCVRVFQEARLAKHGCVAAHTCSSELVGV